MEKPLKILSSAIIVLSATGCGITGGSYFRDFNIEDSSAGLAEFKAEYKTESRFGLRASFNQITMKDSSTLDSKPGFKKDLLTGAQIPVTNIAAIRQGDTYWEAPNDRKVNLALKNTHLGAEVFYLPLDKRRVRLEIGGGVNHVTSDLTIGSNSR